MTATATVRHKLVLVSAKNLGTTPVIIAVAVGGAKYQHKHSFADLAAARRLADKIAEKGSINVECWDLVGVAPQSRAEAHLRAQGAAEQARNAAYVEARLAA